MYSQVERPGWTSTDIQSKCEHCWRWCKCWVRVNKFRPRPPDRLDLWKQEYDPGCHLDMAHGGGIHQCSRGCVNGLSNSNPRPSSTKLHWQRSYGGDAPVMVAPYWTRINKFRDGISRLRATRRYLKSYPHPWPDLWKVSDPLQPYINHSAWYSFPCQINSRSIYNPLIKGCIFQEY